jgi:hypothetical protein
MTVRRFLLHGKIVHGGTIQTPEAQIAELEKRLLETDPDSADFAWRVNALTDEMVLDTKRARDRVYRRIKKASSGSSRPTDPSGASWGLSG